jgi:hypothetical protein
VGGGEEIGVILLDERFVGIEIEMLFLFLVWLAFLFLSIWLFCAAKSEAPPPLCTDHAKAD